MVAEIYIARVTDPATGKSKVVSAGDVYDDVQVSFDDTSPFDGEFRHLDQHAADEALEYQAWKVEIDIDDWKVVGTRPY